MPENGELKLPSTLEPAPNGTIGTLFSVHILAIFATSAVLRGVTTATGLALVFDVDHSEYP